MFRRRVVVLGLVAAAACASRYEGEDEPPGGPDAGDDAGSNVEASAQGEGGADGALDGGASERCDPAKPFGPPQRVDGVNTETGNETAAWLTPDEKQIFFERSNRLMQAARANIDEPFPDAGPVPFTNDINTGSNPTLTADTLTLIVQVGSALRTTTRASATSQFPPPAVMDELNEPNLYERAANLAFGGRDVYFTRGYGDWQILVASRSAPVGLFGTPHEVPELNSETRNDLHPVAREDGLEIYFTSARSVVVQIFVARRPSRTVPFGKPAPVDELNDGGTPASNVPAWVSPDGCVMYWSSDRDGNPDLFRSVRPK